MLDSENDIRTKRDLGKHSASSILSGPLLEMRLYLKLMRISSDRVERT